MLAKLGLPAPRLHISVHLFLYRIARDGALFSLSLCLKFVIWVFGWALFSYH